MTVQTSTRKKYICDKCGTSEDEEDVPFSWVEMRTRSRQFGDKTVHLCHMCKDSMAISELYVDQIHHKISKA